MEIDAAGVSGATTFSIINAMDHLLKEPVGRFGSHQTQIVRAGQKLLKAYEGGNPSELARQLTVVSDLLEKLGQSLDDVADAFKKVPSLTNSVEEYARSFEEACKSARVSLEGNFPAYEVFPFEVRFNLDEQYVMINGRTVRNLRPGPMAEYIRKEREKLYNSVFNVRRFRLALIRAHEVLSEGRGKATPVPLRQIHELLALRDGSGSGGYSLKKFAFDLFRVRQDNLVDGHSRLVFIQGRSLKNTITVPIDNGETENLSALQIQEVV